LGQPDIAMKTSHLVAALCGLLLAGSGRLLAAATDVRTEVVYDHPEKFTDVRDSSMPTDQGSASILSDLRDYLVREGRLYVPAGCKLTITFTDIDLAGDFEPWRGPQFDNVRIIKTIYPPHFKFSYTLADAGGRVLRAGQEDILDDAFELRVSLDHNDPLHYEKDILRDWMRRQMRGVQAVSTAQ
jgi:Protein of unknown function (DUF3016)